MSKYSIPRSHPRYDSLITREKIVKGVVRGVTSIHGLIAQGRGEAWDYLIGEKTNDFAKKAIEAAAAMLLLAEKPVISVNGNVAALVPKEIVRLSESVPAKLEVNLFHASRKREKRIRRELKRHGAKRVLMPSKRYAIKFLDHNRKFVSEEGVYSADVVFVPLEDGDRCEALKKNGKKVITVDLNPLARSSKKAHISIVDNITRAVEGICQEITILRNRSQNELEKIIAEYDNKRNLQRAKEMIKRNLLEKG